MTYKEFAKVTDFHPQYMDFMNWFDITLTVNDREEFRIKRLKEVIIFVYKCIGEYGCENIVSLDDHKGILNVKLKSESIEVKTIIDAAWIAQSEANVYYQFELPF